MYSGAARWSLSVCQGSLRLLSRFVGGIFSAFGLLVGLLGPCFFLLGGNPFSGFGFEGKLKGKPSFVEPPPPPCFDTYPSTIPQKWGAPLKRLPFGLRVKKVGCTAIAGHCAFVQWHPFPFYDWWVRAPHISRPHTLPQQPQPEGRSTCFEQSVYIYKRVLEFPDFNPVFMSSFFSTMCHFETGESSLDAGRRAVERLLEVQNYRFAGREVDLS